MKSRVAYFLTSVIFGLFFLVFTFIVKNDKFTDIDFDTIVKLQDRIPENFDQTFSNISFLASFEILLAVLFIIIAILFARRKFLSPLILFVFAFGHLIELYGKVLLDHPSPPMKFVRQSDAVLFPEWYSHPGSSYPSGHSFRAIFLSIIVIFLIWNAKRIPSPLRVFVSFCLVLFTSLVSFSRVSLGTHWISDVIGGLLLGSNLGFLSLLFL